MSDITFDKIVHHGVVSLLGLVLLPGCGSMRVGVTGSPEQAPGKDPSPYEITRRSSPDLLTFSELSSLAENPEPGGELGEKVERLLSTPFVDNQVFYSSGVPTPRIHPELGPSLRVSTWNIEKSVRVPEAAVALRSEAGFKGLVRPEFLSMEMAYSDAARQRADLAASDVLLLQEMDIGHCRSGYHFSAEHLARELGMNFAYAPQQLEVDPVYLGLDHIRFDNGDVDKEACRVLHGNLPDYRGVFGVAVLSRYPIKRAQIFQLKHQPYSWYHGEAKKADFIEKGRKFGTSVAFEFQPVREIKVGGRGFVRVDLHVPGLPQETLTVINVHLEIKTTPRQRERQLKEILGYLKEIRNPVVLAGDFNNVPQDISATSFLRLTKRTTTNPTNLLAAGLAAADIMGAGQAQRIINGYKNFRDPLAWDVPVVLPNRVKGLFDAVEDFRFADGGAFDFRGDAERSTLGRPGTLSNSNQRHSGKGFTFTHAVPRPIGPIGRQRLDWIFVKSFLTDPDDRSGPYRLAPHFGETLSTMNLSLVEPISDHHPITTVLPLGEPDL